MHIPNTANTVLVLGARGRFGLAVARAFAQAGWRVLGQTRPGAVLPTEPSSIEWLAIDPYDSHALAQAAQGASVVVHALNPAYTNKAWQTQVLPMIDAAITITRALGATLMVPGNVYNFGASMPAVLRENTPQSAGTVKGQIRIAMEQRLQHSGVPSIVIRAGDFFGSGSGTWFDTVLVKNIRKGLFTYPGAPEVSRAWAYLPDLARAFVAVAQRRAALPAFEVLHFAGHRITGQRWSDVLAPIAQAQAWGKPGAALKMAQLPWPVIRIGALLVASWAALLEMRYLWFTPHALANDKLTALIGPEPHTPLAQATQAALVDLGLIPGPPVGAVRPAAQPTAQPKPIH
ncbi:sugar nucleotide-binding protein [Rhodoferax sp. AJA081-3]|uniref:NAD-dependent epimerase/dehydratase family protein n=1 Tax=Rhodoferax sp. AJA081-3 TaxID=2752316 RepID=UPI001ADFB9CD|nr:NAD-dependent epimerase/dehydratase family protein [Rhodoferax sp. AJA081-3]QTN30360.1 sugar nucleotide-binding protein [Rhodoferax sp. AJA081-3]